MFHGGVRLDLFQHDTVIAATWSHSLNRICDLDQSGVPVLLRQPLDSSTGCFAGTPGLTEQSLDIDAAELSLAQTLNPHLIAMLVGSWSRLDGFQSSPYRRVRLLDGLFQAQESHPRLRSRGALTTRIRYAVAKLRASLGFDLRLYRDTWGIDSITGEASWEQPFSRMSNWRFAARARGYLQSRAAFYRDAGESNSYEHAGPAGSYFTADQELAPLADLLTGMRLIHAKRPAAGRRLGHLFIDLEMTVSFDYLKIFPLTPKPPNADRTRGFASALMMAFSSTGRF